GARLARLVRPQIWRLPHRGGCCPGGFIRLRWSRPSSAAFAVAAVQARRAAIHDDDGLGRALVAHRRAGRESDAAVAGDLDILAARRIGHPRLGEQLAAAIVAGYGSVTVFF